MDILSQAGLDSWPAKNVSAALVAGAATETLGDEDAEFRLASVTKLFSAYGVLLAIEEGAFELDEELDERGTTPRHLLAHASGMAFDSREWQKRLGERRIYSSAGFEALAGLVEERSEIAFSDYLAEGVFGPLGMGSTRLEGPAGHGGVSTAGDLARFLRELAEPRLLAQETLREAFAPQYPELAGVVPGYGRFNPCPWGLGFEIKGEKSQHWMGDRVPGDAVGHFGVSGTLLWHVPAWSGDKDLAGCGLVVLTDRDFGDWAKPLWQNASTDVAERLAGR